MSTLSDDKLRVVSACRIVDVKAHSHQGLPLTYQLTTDTGLPSNDFAIDPTTGVVDPTTGVVDLLRPLDYEKDPHQYHLILLRASEMYLKVGYRRPPAL